MGAASKIILNLLSIMFFAGVGGFIGNLLAEEFIKAVFKTNK